MRGIASKLTLFSLLGCLLAACGSSSGTGGTGGGGTGGSGGDAPAECSGGALTHCSGAAYHCMNSAASFFRCAEYADADAATYESLCKQGGGTWGAGCCGETGVQGVCLPLNYCKGMGIGFVTMGEDAAGAKQSCMDTGGTWMDAPSP